MVPESKYPLCGFCDKNSGEVFAMASGKPGNFICDECVAGCVEMFAEIRVRQQVKKALADLASA